MDWWGSLLFLFGGFILLLLMGIPVAFAFLLLNITGAFFFMGGTAGIEQLTFNISSALANFTLTPIPLFVFMGELIFRSGIAMDTINVIDRFLGRVPGRLSILAVASSTLFSGLTGSAISNTALLGSVLLPEMQKKGYHKSLMIGPIVGTGGLAMMIPPSALAVVLGSVAHISIGGILVAGILPGLLMASLYALYIITRSLVDPAAAPAYQTKGMEFSEILKEFFIYILPLFSVVFLVVMPIYLGIATPTESAALGCVVSIGIAVCYRKFSFRVLWESLMETVKITGMIFLITAGSVGFSQIIAFTGAGPGLIEYILSLGLSETAVLVLMLLTLLFLGCIMDQLAMMMITIPFYMPIVNQLAIEPVWFAIMVLIALDIGFTSPPFGLLIFVMKGIAPKDITLIDIYRAALPFIACNVAVLLIVLFYPMIVLYLPGLLR